MGEKLDRFLDSLKGTAKNFSSATTKVLENLEKTDKEIDERLKKATGNID